MEKNTEKYTITCTKEQLNLIANAIEDWARFLSGQCELFNGTCGLENCNDIWDELNKLHSLIVPELHKKYGQFSSYSWNGGDCPNELQKKNIAMGYGIYREIRHFIANENRKPDDWNVFLSPTLRCPDQGPLIEIKKVD